MKYPLENLGPHRFQQLCQALLTRSFPDLQCFPVSQPDGGRDAFITPDTDSDKQTIIFQVKYTEQALGERRPHTLIINELRRELPRLAPNIVGPTKYILMTNVPGTGARGAGSIDVVEELLSEALGTPSQCWWRDDIERRLDDAWDVKWSFPEVFSNQDILRLLLQKDSDGRDKQRSNALAAFVREQFEYDAEVRFQQIDLRNKLLDLFVDVPINIREYVHGEERQREEHRALFEIARQHELESESDDQPLGAAMVLLHPIAQKHLTHVVIEGAPGQGKSTIVQYICQVHRERLLGRDSGTIAGLSTHQTSPIRLPFKVECRDFAVWLDGRNPFTVMDGDSVVGTRHRTLESFLSMQIESAAGGVTFEVSDLHLAVDKFAVLIVCDGLDEVADIGTRRRVVEEITKGIRRLEQLCVSLQTVVTSRPTTFTNSPVPSRGAFVYLHLGPLDGSTIRDYAEKWVRARELSGRDARELRSTLDSRLDQAHLRDLSRNAMQLTILLSLIQRKGTSLPDKRTALYDNYISLFFDREAEKSAVVRERRDLLVDVHGYLGWILHSEAQTQRTGGRIDVDQLRDVVRGYLSRAGHGTELLDSLFTGVVERVVALVSRIEGTYEFEVQPMREYFAARYLYDTAPYSPAGDEKPGTLPERFEALAADFFWQNVTRFYAGCYSQGELPSIVASLRSLSETPGHKSSSYLQSLAVFLLADYTFAQYPLITKEVLDFILGGPDVRLLFAAERYRTRAESLYFPKGSGSDRLVAHCFNELLKIPEDAYAHLLMETIKTNSERAERTGPWWSGLSDLKEARDRTAWLSFGLELEVVQAAKGSEVNGLLSESDQEYCRRLAHLSFGGMWNFVASHEAQVVAVVDELLDRDNPFIVYRKRGTIQEFAAALSARRYWLAFSEPSRRPLATIWDRYQVTGDSGERVDEIESGSSDVLSRCHALVGISRDLAGSWSTDVWASDLGPWTTLIERGRDLFGDRWAFYVLASLAAGVSSRSEQGGSSADLFDSDVPIVQRARYARMRAGQWRWWKRQLRSIASKEQVAFLLLMLFRWAGRSVVVRMKEEIEHELYGMDEEWWSKLVGSLHSLGMLSGRRRLVCVNGRELGEELSERLAAAIWWRTGEKGKELMFRNLLNSYTGPDEAVAEFCQEVALDASVRGRWGTWQELLPGIANRYRMGVRSSGMWFHPLRFLRHRGGMELEVAEGIVAESDHYPMVLLSWAERVCREAGPLSDVIPVGRVAERGGWFRRR